MLALLKKLLDDERGFVITSEWIPIATIVCLGMVVGLTEVTYAVSGELIDVANANNRLHQGRRYHKLGWNDNGENNANIELTGTPAVDEDR
jgi:Flp pilus assembly pilin Flp